MDQRCGIGLLGAFLGAVTPVSAVAAPLSGLFDDGRAVISDPERMPASIWQPWIDNPVDGTAPALLTPDPECRQSPAAKTALEWAPLPKGYDPQDPAAPPLWACVRVAADGRATAAYLIGKPPAGRTAREILGRILVDWEFRSTRGYGPEPGWQRVRINGLSLRELGYIGWTASPGG